MLTPDALRSRARQSGGVKWLECVNRFRAVDLDVPFEQAQLDSIDEKIRDREPVLLDGRHLFAQVEIES